MLYEVITIATCHLKPLGLRETRAYIKHRLCQADWKGDPELTGAALLAIHQWTRGVPRHINKLCNRLLLLGYGKGQHILDAEEVQTISVELREELLTPLGRITSYNVCYTKLLRFTLAFFLFKLGQIAGLG